MFHLLLAVIYLAFISLGLPDSLLGSAWPSMYSGLQVPVSYSGIIFFIISIGTVISSLQSDRLTRKFGAGKVTMVSTAMTMAAMFGFSMSSSFWMLCLWAIPYGLGAGSVDAALNNYVALHYASRHMSWLHCMWGVGASLGPYIMGFALSNQMGWQSGYRIVGLLQPILTILLFFSLPLWKSDRQTETESSQPSKPLSLKEILRIPGVKAVALTFFCYCAFEQTTGLWASSYLVFAKGLPADLAASYASLFFIGITVGRLFSGFLTLKLSDSQLVRLGLFLVLGGILLLVLPLGTVSSLGGLVLSGLGCAPVYPSLIHATPDHFGAHRSQAIIGVQMASAYLGNCLMPPFFGMLSNLAGLQLFPWYLLVLLTVMAIAHQTLIRKTAG